MNKPELLTSIHKRCAAHAAVVIVKKRSQTTVTMRLRKCSRWLIRMTTT